VKPGFRGGKLRFPASEVEHLIAHHRRGVHIRGVPPQLLPGARNKGQKRQRSYGHGRLKGSTTVAKGGGFWGRRAAIHDRDLSKTTREGDKRADRKYRQARAPGGNSGVGKKETAIGRAVRAGSVPQ